MNLGIDAPVQPSHLAILLPALGAVVTLVLVRRSSRLAATIAMGASFLGLFGACALLAQQVEGDVARSPRTIGDLALGGGVTAPLRLLVDDWSVLVCVAVALVAFVVQTFARWYLWTDPRYRQFAATVGLFTAAMQLVVLSGDLVLTLVGWELMGWCSYLLIGHESEREKARRAAYKAFLVTRFADAPLLVGIAALAVGARSTDIPTVLRFWLTEPHASATTLTVAVLGIVCGVLGKSAQIPFQDWLPDAMEGPTPASALIHAATMVAAGTVVLARLLPLVQHADHVRLLLVLLAGVTTVVAALLAFFQQDLKKLLAWSTVSQVGIMLTALGVLPVGSGPDTAITHLIGHAAFKALLFLMFGWATVLVGGTVVPRISGVVRRYPELRRMLAVGFLALAGVPPLVGFVSKDLILDSAAHHAADGDGPALLGLVLLGITTVLTAAYAMRAWLIVHHSTVLERRDDRESFEDSYSVENVGIVELFRDSPQVDEWGREIPVADWVASADHDLEPQPGLLPSTGLLILSFLSVVGGAVVASPLLDLDWQSPDWLLIAAALLLMVAAALLVRVASLGTTYGDASERLPQSWRLLASRGLGVDDAYVGLVVRPVLALARTVASLDARLDRGVEATPGLIRSLGDRTSGVHTRRPTSGLLAVVGGVLVVGVLGVALW
ncbi:NADH-quinone oxidoreductase subunit L [Luteipulveratus sp. YIM 133132]|uniref:NADH-quinone oxidoreductase subunit 5 family protein n=1 Tax=Luteipulveratus flavus TaxID=3031728 RepID=UPI0023B1A0DF|nr:NADH-quinone oxidoreductase subunit L [Luteipulveratus sp. YIM 133132]MDE9365140.1 NADH-quinone oxidoreductase subunit L [Luteipulveratus sp. YIM 133132]